MMTKEDVIRKVKSLLRMAEGDANENESALAMEMAQRLADAHNLDIGTVGQSGARSDEKVKKGFYKYQRTLYYNIASLNHCECWIHPAQPGVKGSRSTVRIVGSKVNVAITKNICSYVENVANRMVREKYESSQFLSRSAHYFREGVIERLIQRIVDKRREEERAREEEKRREQEKHPGSATSIVLISDVAMAEKKANYDYLHGEGAWDRIQEWRRKREEEREAAAAAYEQWKKDNPEEWAKEQERLRKEQEEWEKREARNARARERYRERNGGRYRYRKPDKYDSAEYWEGVEEANHVSLNEQIDNDKGSSAGALPKGD